MTRSISHKESTTFIDKLCPTLKIDVEGKTGEILAGHIVDFELKLHPYGYEAYVCFKTFNDDEINALFAEAKVMKATLTFKSTDPKKIGATLSELQGIVSDRTYKPLGMESENHAVRLYEIRFKDPATITWGNHFPMKIYVDQTMKEVLDAEKNPLISIKYDFDALTKPSQIIAFSLEFRKGQPLHKQVSFYSFLTWYLHQRDGVLEYNYKENSYEIKGKKSEEGKPISIPELDITHALCLFSEPPRYQERMIKHSPENEDHVDQENPDGFKSVRKDAFDDTTHHHFPEQISQVVHSNLHPDKPAIQFYLKRLSSLFGIEQLIPGKLIEIKGFTEIGGAWCDDPIFKDQTFRMNHISIKATQIVKSTSQKKIFENYEIEIQVNAEYKDETYVPRPEFTQPQYPFSIPGEIFSEIGDKEQTTFNIVKHEKSPLGHYLVKVPLAGGEKKVVVPFSPDFTSGQSYFPFCKNQQVMLSMYFQTARIERILDWQPLARLPLDTQANQIVFASNGKDKYFIQRHEFKDGKDSIFIIKQSSSPEQTQTVQIKEKELVITVEEKDKNTVTIQLNRDSGLTLKLKDEASGVTQQSLYNATSITHTSEGSAGKSTIEQKPESISLECKKLNIKCEEGVIEASKTLTQNASNKIFMKSPLVNILDKVKMGG